MFMSVGDSHRRKVLSAVWEIIWAQWRLIQLSAASTPVSLQISDCSHARQKAQTAIDAASRPAGPAPTGAEESCFLFRQKGRLSAGFCFRLQAVGAAQIPSGARLQNLYSFIQTLEFSAVISGVHPRFTERGGCEEGASQQEIKTLFDLDIKGEHVFVVTVICEEELNFTKEN